MKKLLTAFVLLYAFTNLQIYSAESKEAKEQKEEQHVKMIKLKVDNTIFDRVTFKILFRKITLLRDHIEYFYFDPKMPLILNNKLIKFTPEAIDIILKAEEKGFVHIGFYYYPYSSDTHRFEVEYTDNNGLSFSNNGVSIEKISQDLKVQTS